MDKKHSIILLQKNDDTLLCSNAKNKNPLALIPSSLCIHASFDCSEENVLHSAYRSKLLDQNQEYLTFHFHQKIQDKNECFFFPTSLLPHCKFAMLDLFLPTQIVSKELCVLFVYSSHSLLCFYQNQALQYCRKIRTSQEDLKFCIHYLTTLFTQISTLYCLSYISSLPQNLYENLMPLSSLFTSSPKDEGLHFESITLTQQDNILSLTPPAKQSHQLFKFMLISSCVFALSTLTFCFFTHSPPPIKINNTHSLQILSTLNSLPSNKNLFLLLQELSKLLNNTPLLSIKLSNNELLVIEFQDQIPQQLLSLLSSKGYISKILDSTTIEIVL